MSESKFFEITQMMADKNNISNDMLHAASLVNEMFNTKYLTPLNNAIQETLDQVAKNPSREVRFIQSMRTFLGAQNQAQVDEAINLMNQFETMRRIIGQLGAGGVDVNGHPLNGTCVHNDGVYEIDENCMRQKSCNDTSNLFMVMLMMNAFS